MQICDTQLAFKKKRKKTETTTLFVGIMAKYHTEAKPNFPIIF